MSILIDIAAQFTGKQAFLGAEKATKQLTSSAKKLGATLGVTFSTAAVLAYSRASIKAAASDAKAQKLLANELNNVGLGFENIKVESFIAAMERTSAIADDKLRPAFAELVRTTGSVIKTQELMRLALDVSAGSGQDFESVVSALSKSYVGNNKALKSLSLGLTDAELKTMNFDKVTAKLSNTFAGASAASIDSYQGKVDKLNLAFNNASETIGYALITSLEILGNDTNIDGVTSKIDQMALAIGDVSIGISQMISDFNNIGNVKLPDWWGKLEAFAYGGPILGAIGIEASKKGAQTRAFSNLPMSPDVLQASKMTELSKVRSLAELEAERNAKKLLAIKNKQLAAEKATLKAKQLQNAIDKANLALNKGESIFDLDKIQVAAALANQAEQLGKATTGAQILQIANDTARLKVKQDILDLEDAIASGDQKAIEAATAKLNADMKILGSLQNQSIKLLDIKSILESLKPKDLINLDNLNEALRLLGLINLATTGSKTGYSAGTGVASNQYSNQVGNGKYGMQVASSIAATNLNTDLLGGVVSVIGDNLKEYLAPSGGMLSGISPSGREFNFTVNVQTGIGDPNAIAEAVNQVIQDAVDRGTLRGGAY